jgi:hypothetical protein
LGWEAASVQEENAKLKKLLAETMRDVVSSGRARILGFGAPWACARGSEKGRPVDRSPPNGVSRRANDQAGERWREFFAPARRASLRRFCES